jgi:pre-mRNA-splicing factor SYF2
LKKGNPLEEERLERRKRQAEKLEERLKLIENGEDAERKLLLKYSIEEVEEWEKRQKKKAKKADSGFSG